MAVYACADLHGQGWAWDAIKDRLAPSDYLYFLGDAIDRGPYGIRIMQEILDRPNTTYIQGNHEQMMLDGLCGSEKGMDLWTFNGGWPTQKVLANIPEDNVEKLLQEIEALPFYTEYTNSDGIRIIMTHSGYTFNMDDWYKMVWDRTHYYKEGTIPINILIVHGHTPTPSLCRAIGEVIPEGMVWYDNGHKIDIDLGVHFTKKTCLLNLDTLEEEIIYESNDINSQSCSPLFYRREERNQGREFDDSSSTSGRAPY